MRSSPGELVRIWTDLYCAMWAGIIGGLQSARATSLRSSWVEGVPGFVHPVVVDIFESWFKSVWLALYCVSMAENSAWSCAWYWVMCCCCVVMLCVSRLDWSVSDCEATASMPTLAVVIESARSRRDAIAPPLLESGAR